MRRLRFCHGLLVALVLLGTLGGPAKADPSCKCRYYGQRYDLGTLICVRGQLSRCVMVLNNTSWKPIAKGCPEANQSLPLDRVTTVAQLAAALTANSVQPQ
jgi:hypothetical protein